RAALPRSVVLLRSGRDAAGAPRPGGPGALGPGPMRAFAYEHPTRLDDAIALIDGHGPDARPLAGGTDLIIRLRDGSLRPRVVLDVKGIAELDGEVRDEDGFLRFGALTTMTDIAADVRVRRDYPALAESALFVGSVQIRNR